MRRFAVEWNNNRPEGRVEIAHGKLASLQITKGEGATDHDKFGFASGDQCRLVGSVEDGSVSWGSNPTIVTIRNGQRSFSFFLRDVSSAYPIFIPDYEVVVTEPSDARSYNEIAQDIYSKGLQSVVQRMESEPEESFEGAAAATRELHGPTWLGLSRDMRMFEFDNLSDDPCGWECTRIKPIYPTYSGIVFSETGDKTVDYKFYVGRGMGCVQDAARRLEDGVLPIIHGWAVDDDITYNYVTFASLESSPLTAETLRGTHFLVADKHSSGHMLTEDQEKTYESLKDSELNREEETVLYYRVQAVNTALVPRYAFFRAPLPDFVSSANRIENGIGKFASGRAFVVAKLNGEPLPKDEIAIMLKPGETANLDFALPHRPISEDRAIKLIKQDFDTRHRECADFWKAKLASAAQVSLPEQRITEMVQAGLLHLDISSYGLEPNDPVAAGIGVYSPIGTESAPIIQFMDVMGWHDLARRSLEFFLEKQHDDGFIQNFGGYMVETQSALWCMGEHYRYTHDDEWVKKIAPKVLKSVEFLRAWRERNMLEELKGKGYGMLDGKVGDPEDPNRFYMANGYYAVCLSRLAEMFAATNPAQSKKLQAEADAVKQDVRASFYESLAGSPVAPLGDGTWCAITPPWAESQAAMTYLVDNKPMYTHGTFLAREGLAGPLYLAFQEVLDIDEIGTKWMLNFVCDILNQRNVAFSQPYYSRHPWVHLKRGEVKSFLKAYYNCFAGLADRETYDFWEHYFHASPHKTHEEAWFLMETRCMLYMEEKRTLKLLPGIPRVWMEHGKSIDIKNAASYFGPISLHVESHLEQNRIVAFIDCSSDRSLDVVEIRLPHPQYMKARQATGGVYDPAAESVRIDSFGGHAEVTLEF